MFNVKKALVVALSLCCLFQTHAQNQKTIQYEGQTGESLDLEMIEKIIRYKTEVQDSTCTRQVPYQDKECRAETTYEEECRTIPGETTCRTEYDRQCYTDYEQECRTEYDRVCHNETRYRQECQTVQGDRVCHIEHERVCKNVTKYREECSTGPIQQKCHREAARKQCRTLPNGEERCRDIPGREVCEKVPGEKSCRQVAYTEQDCDSVPRERCEFEPPRQQCRDVPYNENVCEDVANRVCEDVPVERCEDVPNEVCHTSDDQVACEDVPKYNEACEDVTRHRDENYTCQKEVQVPYTVKVPVKAFVDILFEDLTEKGEAKFDLNLELQKTAEVKTSIKEQANLLIAQKSEVQIDELEGSRESKIKLSYSIFDKEKALQPLKEELGEFSLGKRTLIVEKIKTAEVGKLRFFLTFKEIQEDGEVVLVSKELSEKEFEYGIINTEPPKLIINLASLGIKTQEDVEYSASLKVKLDLGDVMNAQDSELEISKEEKLKPLKRTGFLGFIL